MGRAQRIPQQGAFERLRRYAESMARATGAKTDLVFYEAGAPHNEFTRRILSKRILLRARPGTDPTGLARGLGLALRERIQYLPGFYIFETSESASGPALAAALRRQAGVLGAEPLLARQQALRLIPNDTLFTDQWHLRNTGQGGGTPGIDLNLASVWDSYRGSGVTVGVVDVGIQYTHPDLAANVNTNLQWDWIGNDADPSPADASEIHGTATSGLVAGRGNNSLGVAGVAYEATLVPMRLLGDTTTDDMEAGAIHHRNDVIWVKSYSWGPADDGRTVEAPGPLALAALEDSVLTGRGGLGVIHVWAGGNGRAYGDNENYDGYVNSIYTISAAACDNRGQQSDYSEPGACIVVTAPSRGNGQAGITTTDLVGANGYSPLDYTSSFGGTSAAAPQVAGVVVLMLEANPNLGWRDVQEVLMRSATKISSSDSDWIDNPAGLHFNHKYGAGLVNAAEALNQARSWVNLGAWTNAVSAQNGLAQTIPDNNPTGVTRSFVMTTPHLRVEHVTVTVSITHPHRGDLAVTLTSPAGMQSRLAELHGDPGADFVDWTFMTVRDWGEDSQGTWTVQVADLKAGHVGVLNSIRLQVFGTATNSPPTLTAISPLSGAVEDQPFTNTCAMLAAASDMADVDSANLSFRVEAIRSGTLTKAGAPAMPGSTLLSAGEALVWTPAPDANGTGLEAFTVVAWDGSLASAPAVPVRVDVIPVNDPPGFTPGPDLWVAQHAGPQSTNWATSVSAGPVDESSQTLSFLVNVDRGYLFTTTPAISSSGILTYTPAPNLRGTATVTVSLQDSGGNDHEGRDTSEARTFTITIGLPQDLDGDGLPDDWEQAWFGEAPAAPGDDADGDGFTNLQEYEAGTNPVDPADAPGIASTEPSGQDIVVSFKTVPGKSYRVEWSGQPQGESWSPVQPDVAGTGGILSVTHQDAGTLSKCYYRLKVLP